LPVPTPHVCVQLEEIHTAFIDHVSAYRGGKLDMTEVTTGSLPSLPCLFCFQSFHFRFSARCLSGEAWLGTQCLEKGLVDEIATSDEYLRRLTKDHLVTPRSIAPLPPPFLFSLLVNRLLLFLFLRFSSRLL
jgi:ClpP class serine protease